MKATPTRGKVTEDMFPKAREYDEMGLYNKDIAAILKVSPATVSAILKYPDYAAYSEGIRQRRYGKKPDGGTIAYGPESPRHLVVDFPEPRRSDPHKEVMTSLALLHDRLDAIEKEVARIAKLWEWKRQPLNTSLPKKGFLFGKQ